MQLALRNVVGRVSRNRDFFGYGLNCNILCRLHLHSYLFIRAVWDWAMPITGKYPQLRVAYYNLHQRIVCLHYNLELVRILDNTNLDEYALTDMPMEQPDESLHELTGIRMAPTSDTLPMSELAPRNGSSSVLHSGVDPCHGSSLPTSRTLPQLSNTRLHYQHRSPTLSTSLAYTINTTHLSLSSGRCHLLHYITVSIVTTTRRVPCRLRCP